MDGVERLDAQSEVYRNEISRAHSSVKFDLNIVHCFEIFINT